VPNVSPNWRRERRCTREKTESVRAFFGVAWDEDEAMDAWMYDVVSAVRVTAPNDSFPLSLSPFRKSCAISWLCLCDVHLAQSRNPLQKSQNSLNFLK